MNWPAIHEAIGGFPFLDDGFDARALASVVAAVRWLRDGKRLTIEEYLRPDVASAVYARFSRIENHPAVPLTSERITAVNDAVATILRARPDWQPLFTAPIDYQWTSVKVSSMNPAYPQQILLGDRAFESAGKLCETLVHEMSHIWYGMLGETAPFMLEGDGPLYTLPSGTPNRPTENVVLASAFAACVLALFRALPRDDQYVAGRLGYVRFYLRGTCDTLKTVPNLTPSGWAVVERLEAFSREEQRLADEAVLA